MRVLAYTSPARGHLYPIVPIMATLARRGHHTSICTLSDELEHLANMGIEGRAMDPAVERNQIQDWRERSPRRAGLSALHTFAERAQSDAPDLDGAIDRDRPDVLLIDINSWGAATAAEASGLPWAMYSPYLLPLPSRDTPPYGMGMRALSGPAGAVRDAIARRVTRSLFDQGSLPALGALRAQYGLPALEHYTDLLARPPLLLSLTAEGFEYPRSDWPSNVRLVGPINWAPPLPAPGWLDDMSDPLALVTCSTERQSDERLVGTALEALPAAGISVIGTTAAHDPDKFQVPRGSKVVDFLPHEAVMERAACVICHGGMGITQKALAAGIPVVVVPFGRDQLEVARRVEVAHAGVRLSPRRLNPDRLLKAVQTALECRAGAERVSRAYAEAGGAMGAVEAVEALSPRVARAQ